MSLMSKPGSGLGQGVASQMLNNSEHLLNIVGVDHV